MNQDDNDKNVNTGETLKDLSDNLEQIDSSIFIAQKLIDSNDIKISDNTSKDDPVFLNISGSIIKEVMLPVLKNLFASRGSISYNFDTLKALEEKKNGDST